MQVLGAKHFPDVRLYLSVIISITLLQIYFVNVFEPVSICRVGRKKKKKEKELGNFQHKKMVIAKKSLCESNLYPEYPRGIKLCLVLSILIPCLPVCALKQ